MEMTEGELGKNTDKSTIMKTIHYTSFMLLGMIFFGTISFGQCDPDFDFGEALWGASPDASIGEQFDTGVRGHSLC